MALTSPDEPGASPVVVWDLELLARPAQPAGPPPEPTLQLTRHEEPAPALSRRFYRLVGQPWYWVDRAEWSDDQWLAWVDRPEHHLWTCWVGPEPVGYFELEEQPGGAVELVYFGLVQGFHGRGIGRWLLSAAVDAAWALPATTRMWLHTCSLDGPNARANYEARGFRLRREQIEYRLVGPVPPG